MKSVGSSAAVAVLLTLAMSGGDVASAQSSSEQQDALRRQIEQRFDVLPLQNGIALRPKGDDRGVRSIELTGGTIAIDSAPATGAELRAKLGSDADLVLRLSYLDPDARQRLLAGSAVVLPERAEPADDSRERDRGRRSRRSGGDQVRFAGNVTVNEDEIVSGDVVAIGGSVRVDGQVSGDAVAIGGSLALGPHADVGGDAVVIGGSLRRDPGARIGGSVVDVGAINFDFGRLRFGRFPFGRRFSFPFDNTAFGLFAFMATLSRVAVLSVLASLVLLVGRAHVERIGARAAAEPVKAGAVGLLAQLLFIPMLVMTILVLVVTIIGIPFLALIPFALLALVVIGLVGFTAVAYNLGRLVNQRFTWSDRNPYLTVVTGIVLLVSPVLIARLLGLADWLLFPITGTLVFLGFLVEYFAWTVGFGAVALQRFARPAAPPPQVPIA